MEEQVLKYIKCPKCGSNKFSVVKTDINRIEIREGHINCDNCNHEFNIHKGILNLLLDPRKEVRLEQKGWVDLIGNSDDSDEYILSLTRPPLGLKNRYGDEQIDHWKSYADNFDQIFNKLDLSGNEKVLNIGAGRCWSTRKFADKGCYCIAIDIVPTKYIGLESSDRYFKSNNLYFERILGDMEDLPFEDGAFDIIFSTSSLHHSSNLDIVFNEISRCLSEKGMLVLTGEPYRGFLKKLRGKPGLEEIRHGINENTYTFLEWRRIIKKSGLIPTFYFPQGAISKIKNEKISYLLKKTVLCSEKLFFLAQIAYGVGITMIAEKTTKRTQRI